MLVRIITALTLVLSLLAGCASGPPDGLVEMAPAYAAQEALAPLVVRPPQVVPLDLAFPEDGTIFSDTPEAYVAGQLKVPSGASDRVDAVIVIDTSHSTASNTRAKATDPGVLSVRGPHRRGHWLASILEVELASALLLLAKAEPEKTRLGVVTFAGFHPSRAPWGAQNARTDVPLTRVLDDVAWGVQRIGARPASGYTDMAAGLNQAIDELVGQGRSRPDPQARKVVVFFTDGRPTLPYRRVEHNELAVIRAAERAADYGVRIFSFAVGPEAVGRPLATVEMARRTGGVFTPVRRPRDLATAVESVRFTSFDDLVIRNVSLDVPARRVQLGRDGTFEALVPLKSGKNRILIRAMMGNHFAEAERVVHYAPGTARPFVPADLEARRLRLTQEGDREIEIGLGNRRQQRLLRVFLEDRRKAEQQAARRLRELELPVDVAAPPPDDASGL